MDCNQEDNRVVVIGTDKAQMFYKFGAFYAKDQTRAFYIGKNSDIQIPGKTLTDADSYFSGKLLRSALRELDAYLCEHMADREMYRTEQFWKDALKYAGRTIMPHVFWIDFRPAPYGYFVMHTSDCGWSCSYNFVDDNYTIKCDKKDSDADFTVMEFCYHGLLDQLLAQRHAESGTAPDAYMEIARMNVFLRDKQSVRCVFKNGRTCQSYSRDPFRADDLIKESHGKFVINPSGYREMPGKNAGLPVMLCHYSIEFTVNPGVFENLDIEIENPGMRQEKEREDLRAKIAGMIPSGSWFPFCKVEMKTAEGHSQTLFHPSNLDTRDDLLKLDAVNDFLRKYCDKTGLQADFVNYSIGAGGPAPMPDEVFALLEQLGHWRWREIPSFAESSVHTAEFDAGFLFDRLYGKDEVSYEKEQSLLLGKIKASIPEDTAYTFSSVLIMCERGKTEDVVSGIIDNEESVTKLPMFRAFCKEYPDECDFYVMAENYQAGTGSLCDMPEDLLKLIKEYGAEDYAAERAAVIGRMKAFTMSREPHGEEDSENQYDSEPATKLMTQAIKDKLKKSPLYSKDGQGGAAEVVVKYFNPSGSGTWLITEGEEQENGDWLLFGMCHIFEWEWGYVLLSELESMRTPPYGLRIERDLYSSGTVTELKGEDENAA